MLRLNGYRSAETVKQALEFVSSKSYLKTTFNQYKNTQKSTVNYQLSYSPLYSEITDFSQISTPVAVLFEDKNCTECAVFHKSTMSLPAIQEQMKRYTLVRLDALSNRPILDFDGNKTTPNKWVKKLQLSYRPGIVLFDEKVETARIESMLYPFHLESVLRFGLNQNYKRYASYLDLMAVRIEKLTQQGVDVNIGAIK